MNFEDYQWIVKHCHFYPSEDNGNVYPFAKNPKYEARVEAILEKNNFLAPSMEEFMNVARSFSRQSQAARINRKEMSNRFISMKPAEIALLPNEQKVEYLDALVPNKITDVEQFDVIKDNKENIQAALFNLKLPKEFWQVEKQQMEKFAEKVKTIPHLKTTLENWPSIEMDQRKELIMNIRDIFCDSYEIAPVKISFMTQEEIKIHNIKLGLPSDAPVNTAFSDGREIKINTNRLEKCDNLLPITLTFHELLHICQAQKDYSKYPIVDKMFEEKFCNLAIDNEDLYFMNPIEVHAYGLDKELHNKLVEDLGIKEISNQYPTEEKKQIQSAADKSRALYAYHQIRNK